MKTTIGLYLYTGRKNNENTYPICLVLYHNKKQLRIPLKYSVKKEFWDRKSESILKEAWDEKLKRKIKINPPVSPSLGWANNYLAGKKLEASKLIAKLDESGQLAALDAVELKKRIQHKALNISFYTFTDQLVEQMQKHKKDGNAEVYKDTKRFLKIFAPDHPELSFEQITPTLLKNIELRYMAKDNSLNGLSHYLRTIRAIYNRAIEEGIVDQERYPFKTYKIRQSKSHKTAISKNDIEKIRAMQFPADSKSYLIKTLFDFSFLCRGMNLTDIAKLKVRNIADGKIRYRRSKSGKDFEIRIKNCKDPTSRIEVILNLYLPGKGPNDYIFPIITNTRKSELEQIKAFRFLTNHYLKRWAKRIGINPTLSFNTARHSWATIGKKELGIEIPIISEGLGHDDIKTTQIYLDSFDDYLIDDASDSITS